MPWEASIRSFTREVWLEIHALEPCKLKQSEQVEAFLVSRIGRTRLIKTWRAQCPVWFYEDYAIASRKVIAASIEEPRRMNLSSSEMSCSLSTQQPRPANDSQTTIPEIYAILTNHAFRMSFSFATMLPIVPRYMALEL